MCGGCAPATGINSPPEGGVQVPQGLRPGPRGLLRRGRHAPWTPWAAPPRVPFGTRAPRGLCLPTGGVPGTGATVAGVGKPQACPCPTPSPSPSPLDSVFQKQGNRSVGKPQACPPEGVSPCSGGGGQTSGPPARAAVHLGWAARLSTAKAGHRAQFSRSKCQPAAGAQVLEKIIEGLLF